MTQRIAYLEAVFGADITNFRRGTAQVRQEIGGLYNMTSGLSRLGRTMTFAVTTPLLAAGVGAVGLASNFEASMRNVNSILLETEDHFQDLTQDTLEFGSNLRGGPQAAAEAFYTVVSAGYTDAAEAMIISQAGAATAEAGLADLTTTTEALTSVMLAYGAEVEEAGAYSDALTRIVQVGVGEMGEYANSMGLVVSSAAGLGVSFEDLGSTWAFMTQRGFGVSRAATSVNRALVGLFKPSEAMEAMFAQLGVTTGGELIENFGGLEGALRAIYAETGNDIEAINELWTSIRGARVIQTIFGDFDAYSESMGEFAEDVRGATEAAREQQNMSFVAHWDHFTSAVSAAGIAIGNELMPALLPLIDGLRDLFLDLSRTNPEIITLGVVMAGAAAAAGPLLWLLGSLLSPIGLLTGAIAGLGVAIAGNFGGIRDTVGTILTDILGDLTPLIDAFDHFFEILFPETPEIPDIGLDGIGDGIIQQAQQAVEIVTIGLGEAVSGDLGKDSVWAAWLRSSGEHSWEEFRNAFQAAVGETPLNEVMAGDYVLTFGDISFDQEGIQAGYIRAAQALQEDMDSDAVTLPSLGERLGQAFREAGPEIVAALEDMWQHATDWFIGEFLPSLDSWAAQVINSIAGGFIVETASGAGSNIIYEGIRSLFSGSIGEAFSNVGDWMWERFPNLMNSINNFFSSFGDWLVNSAIPSLTRTFGYLTGQIIGGLANAIRGAFDWLSGGGLSGVGDAAGGVAAFVGDSIVTPWLVGFNDAMSDTGLDELFDPLISGLEDMLSEGGSLEFLGTLGQRLIDMFSPENLAWVEDNIRQIFQDIADGFVDWINTGVENLWNEIVSGFENIVANIEAMIRPLLVALGLAEEASSAENTSGIGMTTGGAGAFMFENTPEVEITPVVNTEQWEDMAESFGQVLDEEITTVLNSTEVPHGSIWASGEEEAVEAGRKAAGDFSTGIEEGLGIITETFEETTVQMSEGWAVVSTATEVWAAATNTGLEDIGKTSEAVFSTIQLHIGDIAATDFSHLRVVSNNVFFGMLEQVTTIRDTLADIQNIGINGIPASQGGASPTPQGGIPMPLPVSGQRAAGGPTLAGGRYLVGERGPEILDMGSHSGSITSNNRVGGGSVTNNIVINGVQDVDALLRELNRRGIVLE